MQQALHVYRLLYLQICFYCTCVVCELQLHLYRYILITVLQSGLFDKNIELHPILACKMQHCLIKLRYVECSSQVILPWLPFKKCSVATLTISSHPTPFTAFLLQNDQCQLLYTV